MPNQIIEAGVGRVMDTACENNGWNSRMREGVLRVALAMAHVEGDKTLRIHHAEGAVAIAQDGGGVRHIGRQTSVSAMRHTAEYLEEVQAAHVKCYGDAMSAIDEEFHR